ncbi:3-dehydroquinate synthase [Tardisphaera miroshnichenkoae]
MSWTAEYDARFGKARVEVGEGALSSLSSLEGKKALVAPVTLKEEGQKLSDELGAPLYLLPDGEKAKSLKEVMSMLRWLSRQGFTRQDWLIAFGGGTTSDVAGFVSSIYMRGTRFAVAPTTLLAAVDASIGGKNAVNFAGAKNLVGTIRQPSLTVVDTTLLRKLPQQELANGMAEVIKYALSLDRGFYEYLIRRRDEVLGKGDALDEIVMRSIQLKMSVVVRDELDELGIRAVLNVGHTFGHALEAGSGFSLPHGLAVAAGMSAECSLGRKLGVTSDDALESARQLLLEYGLPTTFKEALKFAKTFRPRAAASALSEDKKLRSDGKLLLPLVAEVGTWRAATLPLQELRKVLREAMASWL